MTVTIDAARGHEGAADLVKAFKTTGIHGRTEMPEDALPDGMQKGSLDHLLFITLTVAIDYQRDAPALWASSRATFEDPQTRYLFDPAALHTAEPRRVAEDMRRHGLSKKVEKDPRMWRTVGVTFHKKWSGDPRRFLEACGWAAPRILRGLKDDSHLQNGRLVSGFPYLRGPKIGPLWLRMLRDNVGVSQLTGLDGVPVPVDIHVARATLCLGVVRGHFAGSLASLFEPIRQAWFASVQGLSIKGRAMIALDVDEPLWHLSKYGCGQRNAEIGMCPFQARCEGGRFCVPGKIELVKNRATVAT